MVNQENVIDDFFNRYAARFNRALWNEQFDIDGVVEAFAEEFISAGPFGVQTGKNDQAFRDVIPKGWSYYKNLGIHSMNVLAKKIVFLDEFHAMARIQWQSLFATKDGREGEIEFEVIYILQLREEGIKIFAYITGDEQKAFKDAGLYESEHLQNTSK